MDDHSTPAPEPVADLIGVQLQAGGRALVVSDLHLSSAGTPASRAAAEELAGHLEAWDGPGVVVLAGDCFELLGEDTTDPAGALGAHPRLAAALRAFVGEGRRLVALAGNHDAALAWAPEAAATVRHLGGEVAVAADVVAETGAGPARVRVEHGHRLDPANAFADPHDPAETPLGHHLVRELLPGLAGPGREWLSGLPALADPGDAPAFVGSRLFYRALVRHLGWLPLPFALLALAHAPLLGGVAGVDTWSRRLGFAGLVLVGDVVLVATGLALGARRAFQALSEIPVGRRGRAQNERVREEAARLVDAGYAGLVTGHTHRPELSDLGGGFYANCGCGTEVVERRRGRGGLPAVFRPSSRLSWVELEAGAVLHVRLFHRGDDLPGGTLLERLAGGADPGPRRLTVIASLPAPPDTLHPGWPVAADPAPDRRVRRRAAVVLAAAGALDLASALTPPLRERLSALRAFVPMGVPHAAGELVGLAGVALLLLARGVARGQRRAWRLAVGLLAASAVGHLAKGLDLEEAAVTLAMGGYLLAHRPAFPAGSDRASTRAGLLALGGGAALSTVLRPRRPAAGPHDREPPGRGRAGLLHDARPALRPRRPGAPAGRGLRPRRGPGGVLPVRPRPRHRRYSLDLMRRSAGEHPNGLTDFVVTETIRHLREQGMRNLGLNFATMRAVLAGETGDAPAQRLERWLFHRLSADLQIESLWRYNAKYDPDWRPRYALYQRGGDLLAASLAVARAEGITEIPVLGRWLSPAPAAAAVVPTAGVPAGTPVEAHA